MMAAACTSTRGHVVQLITDARIPCRSDRHNPRHGQRPRTTLWPRRNARRPDDTMSSGAHFARQARPGITEQGEPTISDSRSKSGSSERNLSRIYAGRSDYARSSTLRNSSTTKGNRSIVSPGSAMPLPAFGSPSIHSAPNGHSTPSRSSPWGLRLRWH